MAELYTTISMTGEVATLMNRDAMLSASVSAGTTVLPIGDSYMDRGTNTVVVFPVGTPFSVGTEVATVASVPSSTTIAITSPLLYDHPIYTPCLRHDYFDVATNIGTVTLSQSTIESVDWEFVSTFGVTGTATGQMQSPYGIALDTNGNIYVADGANNRIQVFSPYLAYVTSWGTEGLWEYGQTEPDPGYFFRPQDIAVSSSGTVYVTDLNRRVQAFATDGTFVTKWGEYGSDEGQFIYPLGITFGSDGNIIVCDGQNGRLQVFTPDGEFVSVWGSQGSEEGQFDFPAAVSVASTGDVYVADYNHRISVLSASGAFKFAWGVYGSGDGELGDPEGVIVDPEGYVYVSEIENNRIQVFTSGGTYVSKYGTYGSGDGEFDGPNQIDITSDGRLYVADPGNDRIQVIDASVGFASVQTIRVGMEDVTVASVGTATDHTRFYIEERGANAYPHTEWVPVTDAAYTVNNPATDSEIGRWGVIEDVDYHHGALDQNTLDLYALEKLMAATRPEFGRVEMTGMDVWQDAYYANKKDITYYVDTPTSFATVRFEVYTTTGTDSASKVYIGDTIQKTWWDVRFVTSGMQNYYLATFGTQSATVWLKIKDPATGGATVSMYFGSPMAIDYTLPAMPTGFTVATLGSWSATSTGTFDIGDRGFATVREGDLVTIQELDGATLNYRVSGMIYDQRAGTLTMEIGKPNEYALTDLVKPFRTRDIISTKNL